MAPLLIRALMMGLIAITLPLAARGLYGPPGGWVHIRWQPSVDAAARERLETAWQLVDGQEVSPATWRYDLTAPSERRLRAIVAHTAVADTHDIDRQRYTLAPEARRTARRHGLITVGGAVAVGLVDRLAMLLAALAVARLGGLVRYPMRVTRSLMPHFETAGRVAADMWYALVRSVLGFLGRLASISLAPLERAPTLVQWIGVLDRLLARKRRASIEMNDGEDVRGSRPNDEAREVTKRHGGVRKPPGHSARPGLRNTSRSSDIVCDVVALLLILAALTVALKTTRGLTAPYDRDHFRDVAQAQTARDGHPLTDQYYRGEWAWYNPLLAWTLAYGSALTGTTVEKFHVQAGPWLNLLGPLAFYLLAVRLVGRNAALIALALYLFFISGDEPTWAYAAYSPWLFVNNFAEGIFFSAALALLWASDTCTNARTLVAGALIGLTFLAHTAPALLLAIMACAVFATRWRALLTTGLTALVVASPFLYAIGVQYHFHVRNLDPIAWNWPPITLAGLPQTLRANALLIGAGAIGAILAPSRLLLTWTIAAAGFMLYMIAVAPLIPAFHFWLYATAAFAILAGSTLARFCPNDAWPERTPCKRFTLITMTIVLVAFQWPAYVQHTDFTGNRERSLSRDPTHVAASAFLREVTKPDDVVLGTAEAVLLIIGPAGRKTIAPDPVFASPYVPAESRGVDRDRMLAAIDAGDLQFLTDFARRYDVSTVVSVGPDRCAAAYRLLPLAARFGDVCVSVMPR